MFQSATKRARRSRMLTFETVEGRLCLSADGVVMFPQGSYPETSALESQSVEVTQAITSDSQTQQNPSIAADPLDPDHVVLAFMDYALSSHGYAGIGVAVTRDGGRSWERNAINLPSGFEQGASDLIAKFDSEGHVFVTFMAASFKGKETPPILNPDSGATRALGMKANNGIFLTRSDDGGLNWMSPVAVASHQYDRIHQVPFEIYPDMAVDNVRVLPSGQANPNFGNLYVTWARYYPAQQFPGEPNSIGGSDVMLAVSEDNGLTWQLRTQPRAKSDVVETVLQTNDNTGLDQLPGRGYLNWPRVAVGAAGDVSVADYAGSWFFVNHSDNAGESFFVPSKDNPAGIPFGPGGKLLTAGLSNNSFVPVPTRAIVADPVRPGYLYVAEPLPMLDSLGNLLDSADIYFARSEDYGRTWKSIKFPNSTVTRSVNDDNGGKRSTGSLDDVATDQFMVRMDVNASGDIGLVWYDTRRDPVNHTLDVFGAISTDGGLTFSPNFRVTDQSFDADAGNFTSATGQKLGFPNNSRLGLAMTEDMAYVAWTDTRAGNQDIFFRKLPLHPTPTPLNDRFEPNDVLADATDLGNAVTSTFPLLALDAADSDWFRIKSSATGTLTVSMRTTASPDRLSLQVLDADGENVLGESVLLRDSAGVVVGRQVKVASFAGQKFTIHVASLDSTATYTLETESLTENFGPLALRNVTGSLDANDRAYYLFESTAAGVVVANLAPLTNATGNARIELLDARDLSKPLAVVVGTNPQLSLPVKQGQKLLLRISPADVSGVNVGVTGFRGGFELELKNLDQYTSPAQRSLQFPAGAGPSQMAIGDFNGDGITDVAVTNTGVNTVSVMLGQGSMGKGDGTFSAPRQFAVGAFQAPNPVGDDANLNTFRRDILAADFNQDEILDLVITNWDSSDVSVLLGRGDGTFQPQRRFDAAAFPIGVTAGDVNNDGNLDLVVIDSPEINVPNKLAVLLGRGDGTFQPQKIQEMPKILFLAVVALGDFDKDGTLDLIVGGGINDGLDIFRGVGDGSFVSLGRVEGSRQAASLAITDVDGDGNLDVVAPSLDTNNAVTIIRGTGDLKFKAPIEIDGVGQGPLVVRVVDWGSQIKSDDGKISIGPPDGHLDLLVANSGVIPGPVLSVGPPGVVLLPGLTDAKGAAAGFGAPITLAPAEQPLDLELADFDGDKLLDIAVVDRDGFFVIYSKSVNIQPNLTQATARDLGTVVHIVQPTLTIVPGREDSWFRMQVAGESVMAGGDQVLDFSAGFAHVIGNGLQMEVIDSLGRQRGIGERFRVVARQGETLFVHVFAQHAVGQPGTGAYTLVINTLPQLVTAEATALLPGLGSLAGGPTSSLVLVFQGDRLDPTSAQNPANYRVTWLGPDARFGTGDDRIFTIGAGTNLTQPVVYTPSGNRDVSSGLTNPIAVRQTVTLLFAEALPAGSYQIDISPQLLAASFNSDESSLLSLKTNFPSHSVVSLAAGMIHEGVRRTFENLVSSQGELGNLSAFESGTRFLTQLHADLSALLDTGLSVSGDVLKRNTQELLTQIVARLGPSLGPVGQRQVSLLVLLLDPVSISLVDPEGKRFGYDLQKNTLANNLSNSFVEVGGNVELLVIAQPTGSYQLNIANVPVLARGGWAYLGNQGSGVTVELLTAQMRDGRSSFLLGFASQNVVPILASLAAPPIVRSIVTIATPAYNGALGSSTFVVNLGSNQPPMTAQQNPVKLRSDIGSEWSGVEKRSDWRHRLRDFWQANYNRIIEIWRQTLQRVRHSVLGPMLRKGMDAFHISPIIEEVFNKLVAETKFSHSTVLLSRVSTTHSMTHPEGRSDATRLRAPPEFTQSDTSHILSKYLRHRNIHHEPTRFAIDKTGTVSSVSADAGADANRTQTSVEDRRVGHRAADDDRSPPGNE